MGGSSFDDDWVIASPSSGPRTLVLVGCTGNGKSATCNSILQKEAFVSDADSAGVICTCELHTTVLKDGKILKVIDTPAFSCCINGRMAYCRLLYRDPIHGPILLSQVLKCSSQSTDRGIEETPSLHQMDIERREKRLKDWIAWFF